LLPAIPSTKGDMMFALTGCQGNEGATTMSAVQLIFSVMICKDRLKDDLGVPVNNRLLGCGVRYNYGYHLGPMEAYEIAHQSHTVNASP
jgi:hypothetical protein